MSVKENMQYKTKFSRCQAIRKPGSVLAGHLSSVPITRHIKRIL